MKSVCFHQALLIGVLKSQHETCGDAHYCTFKLIGLLNSKKLACSKGINAVTDSNQLSIPYESNLSIPLVVLTTPNV
jgi:hypothetical protein